MVVVLVVAAAPAFVVGVAAAVVVAVYGVLCGGFVWFIHGGDVFRRRKKGFLANREGFRF